MRQILYTLATLLIATSLMSCNDYDHTYERIQKLEQAQEEAGKVCAIAYDNAEQIINWSDDIEDEQVRDSIQKWAEKISSAAFSCDACGTIEGIIDDLKCEQ